MCRCAYLVVAGLWLLSGSSLLSATRVTEMAWPGETIDTWNGLKRHKFTVDGCPAWVVEPTNALSGAQWSWCMEFPDAFTDRCAALQLLAKGFYHAHIGVGNTFGSP